MKRYDILNESFEKKINMEGMLKKEISEL